LLSNIGNLIWQLKE